MFMRTATKQPAATKGRLALIVILYSLSVAIILVGAGFSVYGLMHRVTFDVMSTSIPGAVFGLVILFLGIRYFYSMSKLKDEVFRSSGFSWKNFLKAGSKKE